MKTHRILLLAAGLFALAFSARAETVKLTRSDAAELYIAIASTEAGLSPANTVAAADNLNALRPYVEALDKGRAAAQRAARKLGLAKPVPADLEDQIQRLSDDLEAKVMKEEISVDLAPIALSDDEIKEAKIKPTVLAQFRRWLKAAKK